jgi:hypothetical protein
MRSLGTGFEELSSVIDDFDFDILGVTETWLSPLISDDCYNVDGYTLWRKDRIDNQKDKDCSGGGIGLYVKNGLKFKLIDLDNVDSRIEYICGTICLKSTLFCICIAYRPPDVVYSCMTTLFDSLFIDKKTEVDEVILLGDLNVNLLDLDRADTKFINRTLDALNLVQIIKEPTRVTETSSTLIDYIVCNKSLGYRSSGVIDTSKIFDWRGVKITDHKLIYCDICVPKNKPSEKFISYRCFKNFDISRFVKLVSSIDWDGMKRLNNVDCIAETLSLKITEVYDACAPLVTKRVTKKKAPWRSEEIKHLSKVKRKLKNRFLQTTSLDDRALYCKTRNALNSAIRRAKEKYFKDNINCKDAKAFWKALRTGGAMKGNENRPKCCFSPDQLNSFFVSMGAGNSISQNKLDFYQNHSFNREKNTEFKFKPVNDDTVKRMMNDIKTTACGTDGISIQMVKALSPYCLGVITTLVNMSLTTGYFPSCWKKALVIPLPKVKHPELVAHFRPISVLSTVSKIIEKVVASQIEPFVEQILPERQSGFRRGFSTTSALLNIVDQIHRARDAKLSSALVMLDFAQAFDSVNVNMLIAKLKYYGFDKTAQNWFHSYLSNRTQITRVEGEISETLPKNTGVPQGSVLGPLMFILYSADLNEELSQCSLYSYADDTQLLFSYNPSDSVGAEQIINDDLLRVKLWARSHGLGLNIKKCSVLHFSSSAYLGCLNIALENERLKATEAVKVLGVTIDSELRFSQHIKTIVQRVVSLLRVLNRFRHMLPEEAKLQMVKSLIMPIINYALPVFGFSLTMENVNILNRLQNNALRFVYKLRKYDHISHHRKLAELLPVQENCTLETVAIVHRVLKTHRPSYLKDKIVARKEIRERPTRQDSMLHLPRVTLELGKKGFSYFGPHRYNELPNNIKKFSYKTFKKKVKMLYM